MSGRRSVFPTWFPVSGWKVKSPGMTLGSTMSGGRRSHERFTYRSGFISGNFKAAVRCKVTIRFPSYFPSYRLLLISPFLFSGLVTRYKTRLCLAPVRDRTTDSSVRQPSKNREASRKRSETIRSPPPVHPPSHLVSRDPSFLPFPRGNSRIAGACSDLLKLFRRRCRIIRGGGAASAN